MTQKEMFEIWDKMKPDVKDVKDYLDRLCGQTPLPLVYMTDGKLWQDNKVHQDKQSDLFGILLSEHQFAYNKYTIVRMQAITEDDSELQLEKKTFDAMMEWARNKYPTEIESRIAIEMDIKLLKRNQKNFETTLEILRYKNIQVPNLRTAYPFWISKNGMYPGSCCLNNGMYCCTLKRYMESYAKDNNVLLFAQYPSEEQ